MKMMTWALPVGLSMLALGGCTHWEKPGGTQQEFNVTQGACNAESFRLYPQAPQEIVIVAGYQTNAITDCNMYGQSISCTTIPGRYVPPATMTVDSNQTSRNIYLSNCLIANGWKEVYN